jgi:signal transduction histidine kinase
VGLQIAFAIALLTVIVVGFNVVHEDVTNTLISKLSEAASGSGGTIPNATAEGILRSVQEVQNSSLLAIIAAIILSTALFGYALARLALIPTRNALEAQKQFIGNVAHELRTPLSIIKTNTEVALFDDSIDQNLRTTLGSNLEELDRVSEIINNLLSLSTFTRPERISFANTDLGIVVDTVLQDLSPLAERKHHSISVKKAEYRLVWGNASALGQIAMNIIKNAINYTPQGGTIAISIEPDYHGHVVFSVKDSGIGIAQKDLFRIFEPFYRAETSRSRLTGSSGLGLAIVSELVKLHNGKISVKSTPRRGTIVTVLFDCGKKPESEETDEVAGEVHEIFSAPKA